jgi:hypothetical protein
MLIPLSKKLKGLTELRTVDPNINELATLLIGKKNVIFTNFQPEHKGYVDKLCHALKLKQLLLPKRHCEPNQKEGSNNLLIGTSLSAVKKAQKAWEDTISLEWGLSLGYPECCIKSYQDWNINFMEQKDLVHYIWEKTKRNNEPLSFYLNNAYNFFSRLCSKTNSGTPSKKILDNFSKIINKNNGQGIPTLLPIITWHPCSYRCRTSLNIAQETYSFLKEYAADFAKERKEFLSRPIIHFDKFEFLALDNPQINRQKTTENISFLKITRPYSILGEGDETTKKEITLRNGRLIKANFPLVIEPGHPAIFLDFSA